MYASVVREAKAFMSPVQESWSAQLLFVVPGCLAGAEDAQLLAAAVGGGCRRKFLLVDREQLLQTVSCLLQVMKL